MSVKQLIQAEIDKMPEEELDELYQVIKEFTAKKNSSHTVFCLENPEKTLLNSYPYHDLDYLAGTWSEGDEKEFLANTKQFNEIEQNLWQ